MKIVFQARLISLFLFIASVLGMAYALYLQHKLMLMPCPLCIFQRIGLIIMGVFSLINFVCYPNKFWAKISLWAISLLGVIWSFGVAVRHVWMTYQPYGEVASCGPGLNYMMDTLPFSQVLKNVFFGGGDCALIDWTLFGLSIPEQSAIFFMVLIAIHGWQFYLYKTNKPFKHAN